MALRQWNEAEEAEMEEVEEVDEELEGNGDEEGEKAGIIRRIRVENFMCHSNLSIDLNPHVNFITGQNGSGKSALLTALCVAFGIKARGTQRANTMKDFIKTGCTYALVSVEMKNEGEDAFKHHLYGDTICVERRITASGVSTFCVKDHQGRKIATRKDEVVALVEHFNIEVQNPCVIMTQDKSKEFLHNGSAKDKYNFFFKSTLLQQVSDVLSQISDKLEAVNESVRELGKALEPQHAALAELNARIDKRAELDGLSARITQVQETLAWAWVHDAKKKFNDQLENLEKFRARVSVCQEKIAGVQLELESIRNDYAAKLANVSSVMVDNAKLREEQDNLSRAHDVAARERASIEEDCNKIRRAIEGTNKNIKLLKDKVAELQERFARETQAEAQEVQGRVESLQAELVVAQSEYREAEQQEQALQGGCENAASVHRSLCSDLEENHRRRRDMDAYMRRLQRQKTDTVTAFGGEVVLNILRNIEQRHHQFNRPPVGPIGAHLSLAGDQSWSLAVEAAVGGLFDSFVVHNQADMLLLRQICKDCGSRANIVIDNFDRPPVQPPTHMLPPQDLTTVLSLLRSQNVIVMNVMIDQGGAERQVLAQDYDAGKQIAFAGRNNNVKEVYLKDGTKMFRRGNVETVLPPRGRRIGRLGARVEEQIEVAHQEMSQLDETIADCQGRKRAAEHTVRQLQEQAQAAKRLKTEAHRRLTRSEAQLRECQREASANEASAVEANTVEIQKDIIDEEAEQQGREGELRKLEVKLAVAHEKCVKLRQSLDLIKADAAGKLTAAEVAGQELADLESKIKDKESEKSHFEKVMDERVLAGIRQAEFSAERLKVLFEEKREKASQLCSEDSIKMPVGTPEALQGELRRLQQQEARQAHGDDSTKEELEEQFAKLKKRVTKRTDTFRGIKTKLEMVEQALEVRYKLFARNARYLSWQLTWNFNQHLRKTGCSGSAKVDHDKQTLELRVTLPQDSSNSAVKDTRALSGGERSFSTLAFALALHQMTESPFRAMDEFDVFMDDVRRKISLSTAVEFALSQGSQWIFITPHDISTVEAGPKVKKQQMANPRP